MVKFMHDIGCSVDYKTILKTETSIAMEVINKMQANNGIYISSGLVKARGCILQLI